MSQEQQVLKKSKFVLFSNDDFKFKMWKVALEEEYGYSCRASKEGLMVLVLLPLLLKRGRVESVVFRYLNDRDSLIKSITFLLSDVLTCTLCYFFQIKVHWVLHNIDKESSVNFPALVKFRRKLVATNARKIYVTDELLLDLARESLPDFKDKIDHISFGRYSPGMITRNVDHNIVSSDMELMNFSLSHFDELTEMIKRLRPEYDLIAFCGGRFSKKRINFKELPNLVKAVKATNIRFLMVVVSDFSPAEDEELFEYCTTTRDIMFVNNLMEMNEFDFQGLIDFYWSGYSDISIPYTIYTAATLEIPILSYDSGILPKVVSHYKIGEVVNRDYSNLSTLLKKLKDKSDYNFVTFLDRNFWRKTADKLVMSLTTP